MSPAHEPPVAPDSDVAAPSKTRRKQAMHALQDLGEALVARDPKRLAELELPERLVDALAQARGIRAHEGRRRQIQYIGRLMRDIDPAPVEAALARWASGAQQDLARFAAVERWRDELLRDEAAIARFVLEHPGADRARLAALVRDARAERLRGAPPRRYRQLFRHVKAALDEAAPSDSSPQASLP
jgi:ribosome-associated protein